MKILKIFTGIALMLFCVNAAAQITKVEEVCYNPNAKGDTSKRSIKSAVKDTIGKASITINYHSPGVRNRTIWGGLVPYGDVWVTGAHNATTIEIDEDFVVNGTTITKGKYALFTIPGKKEWIVIINKNFNQHLTDDYQQSEDIVRIKIKPIKQKSVTERLQYYVESKTNNKGKIAIVWEKLKVEFDIQVGKPKA